MSAIKNTSPTTLLILLAHGSRDPAWQEPFHNLTEQIADQQQHPVRLAFMELCSPTLEEIAAELPDNTRCNIEILPLFFAAGRHLRQDVPEQIEQLNRHYPHLTFTLHDPVGAHPKMTRALTEIATGLKFDT